MTMRVKLLIPALAAFALAGCLGGGAPSQLLTLTAAESRPAAQPRSAGRGEAVTVVVPTTPQALRATRIPVYVNDNVVQYLTGAAWVENPGALFGRLLGETIAARTGRVVLDPAQYSVDPGTRLTGQLVRFGLDPNAMEVVVTYDATIARDTNGGVTTNRFQARVPVAAATAEAVAPALNEAANQVARQVAAWLVG